VMGFNPSKFRGDSRPVEQVSGDECQAFTVKLSEKFGRKFRLPTEAEWEYACRAGTDTTYYWNGNPDVEYMWYDKNSGSTTHDVGTCKPNAWGLYDMSGNVWEWCSDWYDANYYSSSPAKDPQGPGSGSGRVLRGGSWFFSGPNCRSAYRDYYAPDFRGDGIGLRVLAVQAGQ
ncbi:MAG: SUMF1/EgtB/PvdO family nonheme iron enzyme, partial [Candidatus Wallbacteria bacterium]|nr:SUMF1/EgtB/PvdO family nonheme iron enzyme [Candidatus Wallbacteria bacterium]